MRNGLAARIFELTQHPVQAWVVLVISLAITWVAWNIADNFLKERQADRFLFTTEDITAAITKRLQDQEEVLRGGVGLFAASESVSRAEWKQYVDSLSIEEYYPGLQGFGFAPSIGHSALEDHVASTRAEGFPEYGLRPEGDRPVYAPVHYLEPFDWRNQRAFGYDMYSEATRRMAMNRARDTGLPAITGTVTLVQETSENVQLGFLMYLPVYRNGMKIDGVEARRAALVGYVYSPFRVNDLMNGILGASELNVHFQIHDGSRPTSDNMLYDSKDANSDRHGDLETVFRRTVAVSFGGRAWSIQFDADRGFVPLAENSQPLLIASGGLLIDILVFLVVGSLAKQRRRAENLAEAMTAEWREQTARIQAIVDTVQDGIVTIRDNGEIETFNSSAAEIFGYSSPEVIGRNTRMLLTNSTAEQFDARIGNALESGDPAGLDDIRAASGIRSNGTTFPMEIALSRLPFENERIFTAVFRDLTEQKRIERMKTEFISVVSHELRTPLTSLVGALGLVESGVLGPLPPKVDDLVGTAAANAQRLVRLVNDILDAERIDAGRLEVAPEPVEMIALLRKALDELATYAQKYNVNLRLESALDQALVVVDSARMTQVIANLVSNAIKFSPQGEEVTVAVMARRDGIRVCVSDHGPGIPIEMQEKVFERFVQLDATDRRSRDGTGLGLPIAKTIVERHGSRISVDSKLGGGTTMSFTLATIDPAQASDEHESSAPALAGAA